MPPSNVSDPEFVGRLLGRPSKPVFGDEVRELVANKPVIVTGAGGSIGSELVRQLVRLGAGTVCFVDNDEYALYTLQLNLVGHALLADPRFILADVSDAAKIEQIFTSVKPAMVFHAAAHKHLPLLERSPEAAIHTNVLGTDTLAAACVRHGVKQLVNVSTDKAANPTSILGISKRLAEVVAASYAGNGTRIASVRFGNVLGSRGSFLPTLEHLIANGQTVPITHPNVSRYFMTIPEAAGLVLEAAALDGDGQIYVLDMGEPVRMLNLVKRYVDLTGSQPPKITYTGLRQGEKLQEVLFHPTEVCQPTAHPRISSVSVGNAHHVIGQLRELYAFAQRATDSHALITEMRRLVTECETKALTTSGLATSTTEG